MIKTTTTGVCDRCSGECHQKISLIEIKDIQINRFQPATRFLEYRDGIAWNFECEGYHLCETCLSELKNNFMRAKL